MSLVKLTKIYLSFMVPKFDRYIGTLKMTREFNKQLTQSYYQNTTLLDQTKMKMKIFSMRYSTEKLTNSLNMNKSSKQKYVSRNI